MPTIDQLNILWDNELYGVRFEDDNITGGKTSFWQFPYLSRTALDYRILKIKKILSKI